MRKLYITKLVIALDSAQKKVTLGTLPRRTLSEIVKEKKDRNASETHSSSSGGGGGGGGGASSDSLMVVSVDYLPASPRNNTLYLVRGFAPYYPETEAST